MKFTNVLKENENYNSLKKALVNWVLGLDGQDGATCDVLAEIPYSTDMDAILPWDEIDAEIDTAIGRRGNWKDKIADILLVGRDEDNAVSLRCEFDSFICDKACAIVKVYDKIINQLNEMTKKCVVFEKIVGVENGCCKYITIEKFCFDSYLEGINEIWHKYVLPKDGWSYNDFVDAVYDSVSKGSVCIGGVFYCHCENCPANG